VAVTETKRKYGRPSKADKEREAREAAKREAEEQRKLMLERLAAYGMDKLPVEEEQQVELLRRLLLEQCLTDLLLAEPGQMSAPQKRTALDLIKLTGAAPDFSEKHRREAAERAAGSVTNTDEDDAGFNPPDLSEFRDPADEAEGSEQ